jgi:hypothetical protein
MVKETPKKNNTAKLVQSWEKKMASLEDQVSSLTAENKALRTTKTRKVKDPNRVKRPPTAWALFLQGEFAKQKLSNPDVKLIDLMKSDDVKKRYHASKE